MHFTYNLDRAAALHGTRLQTNWLGTGAAISLAFGGAMALASLQILHGNMTYLAATAIVPGVAFGLIMTGAMWFVLLPMRVAIAQRQNPGLCGRIELKADDRGIEVAASEATTRFQWPAFRYFLEDRKVFIVCLSRTMALVVPKSDLSAETIDQFRATLAGRMKKGRTGPASRG